MLILKDHMNLLTDLSKGPFKLDRVSIPQTLVNRRLFELNLMGLIEKKGKEIVLTDAGKKIAGIVEKLRSKNFELETSYWVGPEVIEMIRVVEKTGVMPDEWKSYLEQRGFVSEGKLNELAYELLEAYEKSLSKTKLIVNYEIAELLSSISPGPREIGELLRVRDSLGLSKESVNLLVISKLITFSPPESGEFVYQLTPAGRVLKSIIGKIVTVNSIVVDEHIIELLEKAVLSEEEKDELRMRELFDEDFTEVAKNLLKAFKLIKEEPKVPIPYYVMKDEVKMLKTVSQIQKKWEENEDVDNIPTMERISDKFFEEIKEENKSYGSFLIYSLLSKGLLEERWVKNRKAYFVTPEGNKLLNIFKDLKDDVTTKATKVLAFAFTNKAPKVEWVREAERLDLVHKWLTEKGRFLLELTSKQSSRLLLGKLDAMIVYLLPKDKGIRVEQLVKRIREYMKEEGWKEENERVIELAISQAESRGYVLVERNNAVILTELGKTMKKVLEVGNARNIINTVYAITPLTYEILKSYEKHMEEIKKSIRDGAQRHEVVVKKVSNDVREPVDVVEKNLTIMKNLGLLGDTGLREAGKLLLSMGKEIMEREKLPKFNFE